MYFLYALPVGGTLDTLILDNLNPVSIRVQHECNVLHHAISEALLEVHIERLKAVACSLKIIGRDT